MSAASALPSSHTPNQPSPTLQRLRAASLATTLALIALGLAWELWLVPIGRGTLALKVLPLILALPGLWRYRLYTCRWLSLAVWLYVAEGAVRATSEPGLGAWLAGAEVLLAVLLFVLCAAQVRLRIGAARAAGTLPPAARRSARAR
jgi:uncharacterized membrane protein